MLSMNRLVLSLALAAGLTPVMAAPALAQDAPAAAASAAPRAITWSDPEFEKIAGLLSGTWKSASPVKVGSESFEVVSSFAPVALPEVSNALYAEIARADALDRPYRQVILQLHRHKGKVRMKTMEFRRPKGELLSVIGLWAAPQAFPAISVNDLVTTLDIELAADGAGYKGATPHPYPTSAGGATEMTSEIAFDATSFRSADRGFGSDGQLVWGPAAGETYAFQKVASPITTKIDPDGLVSLTYPSAVEGEAFGESDRITLHYVGVLEDGTLFDSSYERNSPFSYNYGAGMIQGWSRGMEAAQKGLKRRLVVPGPLAYGERVPRGTKLKPNSTLIFAIDVLNVEAGQPAQPLPAPTPAPGTDASKQ
jgi:peptidylprolyl isomerase